MNALNNAQPQEPQDADAQLKLGMCFYQGTGVAQDYKKAAWWFKKAADQGQADAQFIFGFCCYNGRGVAPSYQEASYWFKKAAAQGQVGAQLNLGICYYYGRGEARCLALAIMYYQLVATQEKDAQAKEKANANLLEIDGWVIQANRLKPGQEPYTAADLNNPEIQYQIGRLYQYGGEYTEQSDQEAFKWFQLAADQGYALAQHRLGMCYRHGTGVAKNEAEASRWFEKSEAGYAAYKPKSQYFLKEDKDAEDVFGRSKADVASLVEQQNEKYTTYQ